MLVKILQLEIRKDADLGDKRSILRPQNVLILLTFVVAHFYAFPPSRATNCGVLLQLLDLVGMLSCAIFIDVMV